MIEIYMYSQLACTNSGTISTGEQTFLSDNVSGTSAIDATQIDHVINFPSI